MPTVVLLDVSLSMSKKIDANSPRSTLLSVAQNGIKNFLDFLKHSNSLEPVILMLVSRSIIFLSKLTRDYEFLKNAISKVYTIDKSEPYYALLEAIKYIELHANNDLEFNLIYVSDVHSMQKYLIPSQFDYEKSFKAKFTLHFLCLCHGNEVQFQKSLPVYQSILRKNCSLKPFKININEHYDGGRIWVPDHSIPLAAGVNTIFNEIGQLINSCIVELVCGRLASDMNIYPPLKIDAKRIEVVGFISLKDIEHAGYLSKHSVNSSSRNDWKFFKQTASILLDDLSEKEIKELFLSQPQQPSLVCLLGETIKSETIVPLCRVGSSDLNWFGYFRTHLDGEKNYMFFYLFEQGSDVIPWISDLNELSLEDNEAENIQRSKLKPRSETDNETGDEMETE
ncbi:hypothetical protein SSS_06683 [Sarcoptes scabiei]|uniref:von Willebrand factor A domain-containing protein 9 n=1 Tax=Sarcoptes scabiei TaxID=52283 RepID=A0A131ZWV9_SARSC|nr:hypothetical protein SSS_06683 [Sarcoptes scabiei]KPM03332.1 von Willebrand factor type A domain containing protein [Sarcoptes scabiei]UXI20222.1 mitoferrin-1 [Sarcoptes scabiei]